MSISDNDHNLDVETLSYAPVAVRRRRWWRWVLLLAMGSAIWMGWRWSVPWRSQLVYWYWQRQCLRFERPPGVLAYDEAPESAAALRAEDSRYKVPLRPYFNFPGDRPPVGWTPPALYVPLAWERLGDPDPTRDIAAIAFLHERSIGDMHRLVVVNVGAAGLGATGHSVVLTGRPYQPAPFLSGAPISVPRQRWVIMVNLRLGERFRVYAGQHDPIHTEHFTVRFDIDGKSGTIDGWLRDQTWAKSQDHHWPTNDEAVELRVRDGPGRWTENYVPRKQS